MVYLPKVYCVVDAIDEMDSGNDAFLQALAELGRWRPSRVKVVMTSRPVTSLEQPLRREPILQIRLEESLKIGLLVRPVHRTLRLQYRLP